MSILISYLLVHDSFKCFNGSKMYEWMDSFDFANEHMIGNDFLTLDFIHQLSVGVLVIESSFLINFQVLMMTFSFILIFFSIFIFLMLEMDLLQRYFFVNFLKWKNLLTINYFLLPSVILKICCNLLALHQIITTQNNLDFFLL